MDGTGTQACLNSAELKTESRVNPTFGDKLGHNV